MNELKLNMRVKLTAAGREFVGDNRLGSNDKEAWIDSSATFYIGSLLSSTSTVVYIIGPHASGMWVDVRDVEPYKEINKEEIKQLIKCLDICMCVKVCLCRL